jgi:protein ImuB
VLWIALHLPLLSLESFAATLPGGRADAPVALVDAQHIVAADARARALGVKALLKRATALALAPQLVVGQADAARDAEALAAVVHAALAFTPMVAIEPPHAALPGTADTVLLEVRASLRYFGGLAALVERLHASIAPLGHRLHTISAPTALGAALLARVHPVLHCADHTALRHSLEAAPVWLVGPGRAHWEALQGMGLHTLADLCALPRSGLARRFGEAVLDQLDRAIGTRPDLREPVRPAARFESRLELFARADSTEQLLYGAGVLLGRMVAWLAAQQAFVRRFALTMEHERHRGSHPDATATVLEIALAEPSRDPVHLLVLLRERLGQLQLPAPTLDLVLRADDTVRRAPPNGELFPTPEAEHDGLTRLIERLQARLGPAQVLRLQAVDDHRPERANRLCPADARMHRLLLSAGAVRAGRGATSPKAALFRSSPAAMGGQAGVPTALACSRPLRPVWLLAEPEPLPELGIGPTLSGQPLQLLAGPERIEAGWWDADLVERDYFIAQVPDGALVWIYRSRLPGRALPEGWFLHGRFG